MNYLLRIFVRIFEIRKIICSGVVMALSYRIPSLYDQVTSIIARASSTAKDTRVFLHILVLNHRIKRNWSRNSRVKRSLTRETITVREHKTQVSWSSVRSSPLQGKKSQLCELDGCRKRNGRASKLFLYPNVSYNVINLLWIVHDRSWYFFRWFFQSKRNMQMDAETVVCSLWSFWGWPSTF